MKCKQYGRCSNFDDTECSGEDGSTPIACSHFSKIDLTTIPTSDLVRELCSRDELITATSVYSDEEFVWSKWGNLKNGNWDQFDSGRIRNTNARIIVVRSE